MEILVRLLVVLILLLSGTALRLLSVLGETWIGRLNALAYYVALPALIFSSTHGRTISGLLSRALFIGLVVVLFATALLAWAVHRNSASRLRGVAIVQSYHSNVGYLGLPLIAVTFDDDVTAIASVILGVVSLIQVPLTLLVLVALSGTETSIKHELARLVFNPVLASLIMGLGVGSSGIVVPASLSTGLETIGALALPLALLCVGASLQFDFPANQFGKTVFVTAIKTGWMPLFAWLVFSLLAVDTVAVIAAVVMFGTPTAVTTFVFASEFGFDEKFESLNVFTTTVVSIVTLLLFISVIG